MGDYFGEIELRNGITHIRSNTIVAAEDT